MTEQRIIEKKDILPSSERPTTVGEIEEYLRNPGNRDRILHRRAARIPTFIATHMATAAERKSTVFLSEDKPQPITQETFIELFDPEIPTIAIDLSNGIRGGELIALEAQRRRIKGRPSMNFLFIRSGTDCANIVTTDKGKSAIEVTHGILVGPKGDVFTGELPHPVYSDILETTNKHFLRQSAKKGIRTFNDPEIMTLFDTKSNNEEIAQKAGMKSPRRYSLNQLKKSKNGYVIKPSTTSGGRGVRFFDDPEIIEQYQAFLTKYGYKPIIEERVMSYPLHDPETKERLDWNARVMIAGNRNTGMYIRIGEMETTINLAQGASFLLLEELNKYTDETTAEELTKILLATGQRLAEASPTQFAGGHIIIDEKKSTYLLEVNIGQVGEVEDLALAYDDPEYKLKAPNEIIDAWIEIFSGNPNNELQGEIIHREDAQSDIIALFKGLHDLGEIERLSYISDAEMRLLDADHFDRYLWLFSRYHRKNADEQDIEENFLHHAPLEFTFHLDRILEEYKNHDMHPAKLLRYMEYLDSIVSPSDKLFSMIGPVKAAAHAALFHGHNYQSPPQWKK